MALFRKSCTAALLGIDIGSTAVKLLELRQQGSRYRIEACATEPLPPDALVENAIADPGAVAACLRTVVKRSRTKTRCAAIAVPASAAISKIITMPAGLSDDELHAQIELQADQYLPYPLEEVSLDFQVLGASAHNSNAVDVLLVASRSEHVDARVGVLDMAGLTAKVVDVESYALESAFSLLAPQLPDGGQGQVIAIVDIGASMTTLAVIEQGSLVYTREHAFGGRQLTEAVMNRYGIPYEEAVRAQRLGALADDYGKEVLAPFRDALARQVQRSLQFFFAASQHNQVDLLLLAGGCAAIPGVAAAVRFATGTATLVANPFLAMTAASDLPARRLAEDAPAMLTACGLALRGFD